MTCGSCPHILTRNVRHFKSTCLTHTRKVFIKIYENFVYDTHVQLLTNAVKYAEVKKP
jgi:hypothetical protein